MLGSRNNQGTSRGGWQAGGCESLVSLTRLTSISLCPPWNMQKEKPPLEESEEKVSTL